MLVSHMLWKVPNGVGHGVCVVVQVARAVYQMLGDEEGEAEQMVAVLDARQATTLQVTRKVNLIKRLALALNQVPMA